jgi:hypothetical protein
MNFKLSPVVIRWDNLVLTTQALVMGYRHGYGILEHTRRAFEVPRREETA